MGYTHYLDIPTISERLASDAESIIKQAEREGITLAGPDGNGSPIVSASGISFNGSRALMQHHEPLVLPTTIHASHFCKTERLPYDTVVTAILVSAIVDGNGCYISSNGTYADWLDGIALYERAVRKLTQSERQRVRRLLNHEFRPFVIKRLLADGFAVTIADDIDALNGTYTIMDSRDGNAIAASGSADSIVYNAMGGDGIGGYCYSERLADTIRDIVSRKRESYYHKGVDATAKRNWFDEYVWTRGYNIDMGNGVEHKHVEKTHIESYTMYTNLKIAQHEDVTSGMTVPGLFDLLMEHQDNNSYPYTVTKVCVGYYDKNGNKQKHAVPFGEVVPMYNRKHINMWMLEVCGGDNSQDKFVIRFWNKVNNRSESRLEVAVFPKISFGQGDDMVYESVDAMYNRFTQFINPAIYGNNVNYIDALCF